MNYNETFAPFASLESMRIICAISAKYNLELDKLDVQTAYLNGTLLEDIYMFPSEGVDVPAGHCWKLKQSLYGLKQAGRMWNKTFYCALRALGFTRLDAETCLYALHEGNNVCFLVIYVDNLLLAASTRAYMDDVNILHARRRRCKHNSRHPHRT